MLDVMRVNGVEYTMIKIVGIIFGSGRYEKYIPIDIEVLEEHRKRGVAKALTSAFVKHCIECGLIPHWDCVESNTGSIRLAESIGFEKLRKGLFIGLIFNVGFVLKLVGHRNLIRLQSLLA